MANHIETIKKNIETLDKLRKQIPGFEEHLTGVKVDRELINNMRLHDFENFYMWLKDKTQDEIYLVGLVPLTWKELKPIVIKNTRSDFVKTVTAKSEKQFQHMMNSRQSLRKYSSLWRNADVLKGIQGYLLNNPLVKYDNYYINVYAKWYLQTLVPSDYIYTQKEIDATDELINKIADSINYDEVSRINVSQFSNKLTESIRAKILTVIKRGSKLKCKDAPGDGLLIPGKIYEVSGSSVNSDGFLYVTVNNESNNPRQYMYTVFEELSKERESQLDDLLNLLS